MMYRCPHCNNTYYFDNRNIYSTPHYLVTPQYYCQPHPNSSPDLWYRDPCECQQGTDTEWSTTAYHNEPELEPITERAMKLLADVTSTYGWNHEGHQSWGGRWGIRAVNEATEEIRNTVARMVNLKQLETFTKKDLKSSLDVAGAKGKDSASIKIGWAQSKSSTDQMNWINQNNFLIDVRDVHIVPGTDWSKTTKDWTGKRRWQASALMQYRLLIWGNA